MSAHCVKNWRSRLPILLVWGLQSDLAKVSQASLWSSDIEAMLKYKQQIYQVSPWTSDFSGYGERRWIDTYLLIIGNNDWYTSVVFCWQIREIYVD